MDVSMELMTTMMMQADNRLHHNPEFTRIAPREAPPHLQNQSTKWYAELEKQRSIAAMREMMFRIAAMQPVQIDPEAIKPPKRKNVKISKDPQSVAARRRRERISEKIRMLQRMVPGGTKMDTASMLDEAIHYVKFLKKQVVRLESVALGFEEFPLKMLESQMMMGLGGSMQQMMC